MSKKASDTLTGANLCLGNSLPVLATNTVATSAVPISLNGNIYAIAGAAAAVLPTTDGFTKKAFVALNKNEACVFVLAVDKTGARAVFQGRVGSETGFAGGSDALEMPAQIPENFCPIAYLTARSTNAATGGWLPAQNFSGVTGVTVTAQPVCHLPSGPMLVTG